MSSTGGSLVCLVLTGADVLLQQDGGHGLTELTVNQRNPAEEGVYDMKECRVLGEIFKH